MPSYDPSDEEEKTQTLLHLPYQCRALYHQSFHNRLLLLQKAHHSFQDSECKAFHSSMQDSNGSYPVSVPLRKHGSHICHSRQHPYIPYPVDRYFRHPFSDKPSGFCFHNPLQYNRLRSQ